jgi:hypothetical protein
MRSSAEQLCDKYKCFFGEHGLAIEEGKLTLYYSGVWIHYAILGLCRKAPREVSLWLSGRRTAAQPLADRFRRILETGSTVRVIYDRRVDIDAAKEVLDQYGSRLEMRFTKVGTTRRMMLVRDALALDGLRILPADMPAPSYIGTAYLDQASIQHLAESFDGKWEMETEPI